MTLFFLPVEFSILLALAGPVLAFRYSSRAAASVFLLAACATIAFQRLRVADLLSLSDFCFGLATLFLVPNLIQGGLSRLRFQRRLLLGIGLMSLGGLLGTMFAPDVLESLGRLGLFALQTSWIVVLLAIWAPGRRELRLAIWAWLTSVALSSLYAVFSPERDINGRAFGLTTHPNELALLCVIAAGPASVIFIRGSRRERLLALAYGTVIPLGILFSGSRAGFFGYLAVLLVVVALAQTRVDSAVVLAGPALALSLTLVGLVHAPTPNALQRVFVVQNAQVQHSLTVSNAERRELLESNLDRIAHFPLTGQGFQYVTAAHDIYLQAWASGGLLALLGLAVIVLEALTPVWLAFRRARDGLLDVPDGLLAFGLSAGYAGYLVAALFQNVVADRFLWLAPIFVGCLLPELAPGRGRLRSGYSPLRAALALLSLPRDG